MAAPQKGARPAIDGPAGRSRGLTGDMLNKRHYITLASVVLLVAVLLTLPNRAADGLKLAINGLFVPLIGLAATTHQAAANAGDALTSRRALLLENSQLRTNNQRLALQLQQAANALRENDQLRQMLNFRRQKPAWNLLPARVIARDPETWWRSVWIDLGSRTPGMRTNLAVLTSEGLAGKVVSVGETRSRVVLLGDPSLRVAVLVGPNHLNGTLRAGAAGARENHLLDVENLFGETADRMVRPGDDVVTWGEAGLVFPAGISVGKVVDVPQKDYGATTEARVRLSANLDALENVWVMIAP
jgi:rod shape-determining protein MreC